MYILILAHYPYFEKKKEVGLCDLHGVCVSVYLPYQLLNG
jgi:hypothetical protein